MIMEVKMNLDEIEIEVRPQRTCDVDISQWTKAPLVITLTEPDVAATFEAAAEVAVFKKRNPTWPDSLCRIVAALAHSHAAPPPGKTGPGIFYERLAKQNADAFSAVMTAYNTEFASADTLPAAIDDAKNA